MIEIEKKYRETKKAFWKKLNSILEKPRRKRIAVNLHKLSKMHKRFPKKILLVPGKVLGKGDFDAKVEIVAKSFSSGAEQKIKKAGGEAIRIKEFLKKKIKESELQIVF